MVSEAFSERQFASRYSITPVGLHVHKAGALADADANAVDVAMGTLDGLTTVFSRTAARVSLGVYQTSLSSVETATPGVYQVRWTYAADAVPQVFVGLLEVGESSPVYDALDVGFRAIVEAVYLRFADLFDSPTGGPHLQVYFQTRFGRGRMAQLLGAAVGRLNTVAQPHQTYSLDPAVAPFPYLQWGPLLEQALYVETLKHLIRSYVEQPSADGVAVARMDRRDYVDRWRAVLADEAEDYRGMLDTFKIANMGLGRPTVLVSGGVYGNLFSPIRTPGEMAARGYWRAGF